MFFLRHVACSVVAVALATPAFAQVPLPIDTASTDATAATVTPIDQLPVQPPRPGLPLPADVITARTSDAKTGNVFKLVAGDFKNFFSRDTALVMGFVSIGAVAAAPWDREGVNNGFGIPTTLFESGNIVGQFLFQASAGLAGYGLGRAVGSEKLTLAGRDVVRAQLLSQILVQAVKATVRRPRPDGSNKGAFPSGHAASAFATAGVLHRYYGWKVGVPGYAVGSYVALARMAWNRHHATDVVMGMGFGLASARTVTMKVGGSQFKLGVQPQAAGASINFTKIYK